MQSDCLAAGRPHPDCWVQCWVLPCQLRPLWQLAYYLKARELMLSHLSTVSSLGCCMRLLGLRQPFWGLSYCQVASRLRQALRQSAPASLFGTGLATARARLLTLLGLSCERLGRHTSKFALHRHRTVDHHGRGSSQVHTTKKKLRQDCYLADVHGFDLQVRPCTDATHTLKPLACLCVPKHSDTLK